MTTSGDIHSTKETEVILKILMALGILVSAGIAQGQVVPTVVETEYIINSTKLTCEQPLPDIYISYFTEGAKDILRNEARIACKGSPLSLGPAKIEISCTREELDNTIKFARHKLSASTTATCVSLQ